MLQIPLLKAPARHSPAASQLLLSLLSNTLLLGFALTKHINTPLLVSVGLRSLKTGLGLAVWPIILFSLLLLELILLPRGLLFGLTLILLLDLLLLDLLLLELILLSSGLLFSLSGLLLLSRLILLRLPSRLCLLLESLSLLLGLSSRGHPLITVPLVLLGTDRDHRACDQGGPKHNRSGSSRQPIAFHLSFTLLRSSFPKFAFAPLKGNLRSKLQPYVSQHLLS